MTAQNSFKKNDVIELFTVAQLECNKLVEETSEKIKSAQSEDEIKALQVVVKKYKTKAKYINRILQSETIADAVALAIVRFKTTREQLSSIIQDSYSLDKLSALMLCIVQKRVVESKDEHALSEYIALTVQGVNDVTYDQLRLKMTTTKKTPYVDTRQAQMVAKLLQRLNAVKFLKNGSQIVVHFDHESALSKAIMKAYE